MGERDGTGHTYTFTWLGMLGSFVVLFISNWGALRAWGKDVNSYSLLIIKCHYFIRDFTSIYPNEISPSNTEVVSVCPYLEFRI